MKARGSVRAVEHEFGFCWWVWLVALVLAGCSSSHSDNGAGTSSALPAATTPEQAVAPAPAPPGAAPAGVSASLPFGCTCGGVRTTCGTPLNSCTRSICVNDDPRD